MIPWLKNLGFEERYNDDVYRHDTLKITVNFLETAECLMAGPCDAISEIAGKLEKVIPNDMGTYPYKHLELYRQGFSVARHHWRPTIGTLSSEMRMEVIPACGKLYYWMSRHFKGCGFKLFKHLSGATKRARAPSSTLFVILSNPLSPLTHCF